jgi:hypothetical protein
MGPASLGIIAYGRRIGKEKAREIEFSGWERGLLVRIEREAPTTFTVDTVAEKRANSFAVRMGRLHSEEYAQHFRGLSAVPAP